MIFDTIVIGSGAGGALAAYGLQKRGARVLLIEKGNWGDGKKHQRNVYNSYYRDRGMVGAIGNLFIGIPTGEGVGGTTTINSGTCFEIPRSVVEDWKQNLSLNIEYDELSPYFKTLRELLSIQRVTEGRISEGNRLFRKGAEALGFNQYYPLERNEKKCVGSGRCCFICPTQAKQSMDVAIIPKFTDLGGTLTTGTEVLKIDEKRNEVEVNCRKGGRERIRFRGKRLVISGGALSSPILIRKSRIGNAWRRAGNELSIHPAVKVLGKYASDVHAWKGVPQALGFKHPNFPTLHFEGLFVPKSFFGPVLPVEGEQLNSWISNYDRVAAFGLMAKDTSRGRVRSLPWWGLFVNYKMNRHDIESLIEGARFIGLAYLASGAEKVLIPVAGIQNEFSTMDELKSFDFSSIKASQLYTMGFHPLGTCGMGRVVDEDLRVYGSQRIYVADGSVIPTSLGVNPQVTIMALALRLVDRLSNLT